MPGSVSKASDERFMRWARELDYLTVSLYKSKASISEQVQAYKQAEKRILRETRTAFERQEMRRRIVEWILMATSEGPWSGFSPYLRKLERLGYSSMFKRLSACCLAARAAKGSQAGVRKTAALIADVERRIRGRRLHPAVQEEFDVALARARAFIGLNAEPRANESTLRRKKAKARTRR